MAKKRRPNRLVIGLADVRAAAQAPNTRIAYEKGWRCFAEYCARAGVDPLAASPRLVVEFFTEMATQPRPNGRPLSLPTLTMYRSAIKRRHVEAGLRSPTIDAEVETAFRGLARLIEHTPRRVKALREHHISAMLDVADGSSTIGLRDAAVLAVGFSAALRRSEICGLHVGDVQFINADKMVIHIRRSKTDQAGKGQSVAVPNGKHIGAVARLHAWLDAAGHAEGPVFQTLSRGGRLRGRPLHHGDIARLVKRYAAEIGLDPKDYAGHSLRAGFVTSAAVHEARLDKIMEVSRHKSAGMVLRYVRDANAFTDHAGADFL